MPFSWSASGLRTVFGCDLEFLESGVAQVRNVAPQQGLALGTNAQWTVGDARWGVEEKTLRLRLKHGGFCVGDCDLEDGSLDLALPVFKRSDDSLLLSSREGIMSIIAYRFLLRKERRIVGTWTVVPAEGPQV